MLSDKTRYLTVYFTFLYLKKYVYIEKDNYNVNSGYSKWLKKGDFTSTTI